MKKEKKKEELNLYTIKVQNVKNYSLRRRQTNETAFQYSGLCVNKQNICILCLESKLNNTSNLNIKSCPTLQK